MDTVLVLARYVQDFLGCCGTPVIYKLALNVKPNVFRGNFPNISMFMITYCLVFIYKQTLFFNLH